MIIRKFANLFQTIPSQFEDGASGVGNWECGLTWRAGYGIIPSSLNQVHLLQRKEGKWFLKKHTGTLRLVFAFILMVICFRLVALLFFLAMIVLHELGHYLAARRYGIETARLSLEAGDIGIVAKDFLQMTVGKFYLVVMSGLIGGLVVTIITNLLYLGFRNPSLAGAAMICYILGLINLIPFGGSDGERMFRMGLACSIGTNHRDQLISELMVPEEKEYDKLCYTKNHSLQMGYVSLIVLHLSLAGSLWMACPEVFKHIFR